MRAVVAIVILAAFAAAVATITAFPREGRRDKLKILAIAIVVRLALVIVVVTFVSDSLLSDEISYVNGARRFAENGTLSPYGYANSLGWLFRLTGVNVWVAKGLTILASCATALVTYEVVRRSIGATAALSAGIAVALWPSLALWSVLVLKDTWVVLAVILFVAGMWGAAKRGWWGLAAVTIGCAILSGIRPWAYVLTAGAGLLATVAIWMKSGRATPLQLPYALVLVGMVGLLGGEGFLGSTYAQQYTGIEIISETRAGGSVGDTAFTDAPESASEISEGIPEGVIYNLLGPFPWQPKDTTMQVLSLFEGLVWLAVLVLAARGVRTITRAALLRDWLGPLCFVGGTVAVLAIYESNAGTAFRVRAMIIPIVIALASVNAEPDTPVSHV